jgi:hypothetical protein
LGGTGGDWLTADVLLDDEAVNGAVGCLNRVQQEVAEETTEPWPATSGPGYGGFSEPDGEVIDEDLRLWFWIAQCAGAPAQPDIAARGTARRVTAARPRSERQRYGFGVRRLGRRDVWLVTAAVAVGVAACGSIQESCFDLMTEPFARPESGAPRAGYCGPIDHWYRWVLFPVASVFVALAFFRLFRRLRYSRVLALVTLCALAIANYLVVNSLGYYIAV